MPIVEIEIVLKPGEVIQDSTTGKLADQPGQIFSLPEGCRPEAGE